MPLKVVEAPSQCCMSCIRVRQLFYFLRVDVTPTILGAGGAVLLPQLRFQLAGFEQRIVHAAPTQRTVVPLTDQEKVGFNQLRQNWQPAVSWS